MAEATTDSSTKYARDWRLADCRTTKPLKTPAAHQRDALSLLHRWYGKEQVAADGGILVLPTGGGKTFTAIQLLCHGPLSDGYKVLWLAHTHHLLEQAFHGFSADVVGQIREPRSKLKLRVVSGAPGHYPPHTISPSDDVVLATLQTISNAHRLELEQFGAFVESASGKLFIVFDEAHHAPAPSYRKLLQALQEGGARTLGLTATPTYANESKKGWLKRLFPSGIIAQARTTDLIAQGILARPNFITRPTCIVPKFSSAEYEKWVGTYRDLPEDIVTRLAEDRERNSMIAQTYADNRAKFGKTIIFADRWYQCEFISETLSNLGLRADCVYAHVDLTDRTVETRRRRDRDANARIIDQFRRGELDVIINVRMLTEGTDLPDAQTVFLTRQTTSEILMTQMIGRALRGPKFGGTAEAYVVSFVDDWQHAIRWADYTLEDGGTETGPDQRPERAPIQLISIELVKRLARAMGPGAVALPPFISSMPVGWYRATYDTLVAGSEEVATTDRLVMVFDDEQAGMGGLLADLIAATPEGFDGESMDPQAHRPTLDALRAKHLPQTGRSPDELAFEILHLARHVAQGHGSPQYFAFDQRDNHDLESIVRDHIRRDLGPTSIRDLLQAEYVRADRFWRVFYSRFDQFLAAYLAYQASALSGSNGTTPRPGPVSSLSPDGLRPEEKEQVKRRDQYRCLACGEAQARRLQIDHIVPYWRGGSDHFDNLQTLCRSCNQLKAVRTIRFTNRHTSLSAPPSVLEDLELPDDPSSREEWIRFLTGTLNFTFQCGAVSDVRIGARGDGYYNWEVELMRGNRPTWMKEHIRDLFDSIQEIRTCAGKPVLKSLTLTAPGEEPLRYQG